MKLGCFLKEFLKKSETTKLGSKFNFSGSFVILFLVLLNRSVYAQTQDSILPSDKLKKMSLEELMNIEVTSVSKRPEKLNEVASAVQVITQKDIRNSGAKTLAEALRLASNLQVAQVNSSQWAVSARGFNNVLANKLLVLIDGRTVYTPLYAGVFWDVQNLLLENVDRIEVISGPGGTMWGANAVNGVINIITKSANETTGVFAETAIGTALPGLASIRVGGKLADRLFYRVYGSGFKMGSVVLPNDSSAKDEWSMAQGGFRIDWETQAKDKIMLQSNIYNARPNPDSDSTAIMARGDNATLRWNRQVSGKSDFQLQTYYDHTFRDFNNGFKEDLKTFDIDWQYRFELGRRNRISFGLDFRSMDHSVTNLPLFVFLPANKTLYLYSLFLQDEIMLVKERLKLTIGAKVENNVYTNFQYQPNGRFTWTPGNHQTIWGAVSRAVRNPARIDRDFAVSAAPGIALITGTNTFLSETVIAYELGWRSQPLKNLSLSLSTFFNVYDNIRSALPGSGPFAPYPITFGNGVRGETYGVEFSIGHQLTDWWSLRGGYTFLHKDLWVKDGQVDLNKATAESDDPENQFLIQSVLNLPGHLDFGTVLRYVDILSVKHVPDYMGLDLRLAWHLNDNFELSIVGQNLLDNRHPEFVPSSPSPREIQRSIYGKIIVRF